MAIIQMRHGAYTDFDPTKMADAELAVVQEGDPNTASGQAMYVCFDTNEVKRIATEEEIPSPPSTNGTYHLTCTVSSGTVTYSWTS